MRRKINGDERSGRLHERYRKLYLVSAGGMTVLKAVGQHGSVCRRDRDGGKKERNEASEREQGRGGWRHERSDSKVLSVYSAVPGKIQDMDRSQEQKGPFSSQAALGA